MTGYGERSYEEGSYTGYFENGLRHGVGRYESEEDSWEGSWAHDKQHGQFVFTNAEGTKTVQTWENGAMTSENPF
jgi:hypothetical protein